MVYRRGLFKLLACATGLHILLDDRIEVLYILDPRKQPARHS